MEESMPVLNLNVFLPKGLDKDKGDGDFGLPKNDFSPETENNLRMLLKGLSAGEVILDKDNAGKIFVTYPQERQVTRDASTANRISEPKLDEDVKLKVNACLELINYFKKKKSSSGVCLDNTMITLSGKKEYREGSDFKYTEKVLGTGNSAGDIFVVKDKKHGKEHAQKTIMISVFREEEIRCWVDMAESGYVPALYLFHIENNKIYIHMEILKNAKTLRSVIDEQMSEFYKSESLQSLIKPFSLLVLDGALEAISAFHDKNWTHRDCHAGNIMVEKISTESFKVKIIDFGLAGILEGSYGFDARGFKYDISELLRIFCALYTGQEFNNVTDMWNNWQKSLCEVTQGMSREDRTELFCLVDAVMAIVNSADVKPFSEIKKSMEKYKEDVRQSALKAVDTETLKKIVAILFPEDFKSVHPEYEDQPDFYQKGLSLHVTVARSSALNGDIDVADNRVVSYPAEYKVDYESKTVPDVGVFSVANHVTDDYLEQLRRFVGIECHELPMLNTEWKQLVHD